MKVALVVMPFAAVDRPSLAAGLLQASLRRRGIDCVTKNFNLTLAKIMGLDSYAYFSQDVPVTALAGEWCFSQHYHGSLFSSWSSYEREVLEEPLWGVRAAERARIPALLEKIPTFLQVAFASNDWSRYDLIGFTSTFEQTMASLSLARMIRKRHPGVKIAMGGANFEAGMARPYLEHFDFLDFVSTGEADTSFPELCERLREAGGAPILMPPGFVYRENGEVKESPRRPDLGKVDLDALPTPDFGGFFEAARATLPSHAPVMLTVQAARGCWWGQRSHCTFCGLNGDSMEFRHKSWRRVVEETDELAARHGPIPLQFADDIVALSYFKDLFPHWAERGNPTSKLFEIKSNIKRDELVLLKRAGVDIVQPGIESLADGTLRVMRKGVSAAQNVAVIRWCKELGITAYWNLIFGFPEEDPADYERTAALLGKIAHLTPPVACAQIRMDRFSPNHSQFKERGFTHVEPMPAYRHVYPFSDGALDRIAYYFRYDHPRMAQVQEAGRRLGSLCADWRRRSRQSSDERAVRSQAAGYVLVERRDGAEVDARSLTLAELALLGACDAPTSAARALERASASTPATPAAVLSEALDALVAREAVAEVGAHLVTLTELPLDFPFRRANSAEFITLTRRDAHVQ